ncbi:sugar ABC transporter substrate-binding protein [Microbacterium sp. ABRD28]|uniref:ABC transporter substrate-binding protein n=1 Tax=Microbacterium sp. ABRD28 TaxID=2268461 RepID=UPI000F54CFE7|nr:sugar ABC transporter substrate-binding protein [Microbacterium sp. ABRD28]AZC13908.1 sugar ABC transporter substrate-binding protein [Microbacterium sp. ABRD28]
MTLNRTRRTLLAGATATGLALALAGCGLEGVDTGSEASADELSTVEGEISFATLELSSNPDLAAYIEDTIAAFEEEYPGTEVEWIDVPFAGAQEKFAADAAAGNLPDVVNMNPNFAQPLEREGVFLDIDQADPELAAEYVEGAWKGFQVPGMEGTFGVPWYLTSEVTMYNAALYEAAGLDPDDAPETFAELYEDARAISEAGAGEFYGLHPALENRFMTDLAKIGVPLIDEDLVWTFNTPDAVEYVEGLAEMYQSGVFPADSLTQTLNDAKEGYQAGNVAMFPSGPNFLNGIEQNAPEVFANTRVAPQIAAEGEPVNMSVMGLLIPKTSENPGTALAFTKFITNAENQLAFSRVAPVLPSVTAALDDPFFQDDSDGTELSKAVKLSAEGLARAENLTPVQYDDQVKNAVLAKIQLALTGDLTAQEALDQAVEEANAITGGGE